jgi:predicted RNA binding protein YcfA (HicA-like mRNA interferase family)
MSNVPAPNGKQVLRALQKLGFRLDRVEGSHHMMVKPEHPFTIPVPVHGSQPLPRGTLASIIRMAGTPKKQFFDALRR